MGHLALGGNILSSMGTTRNPKLYYKANVPVYNDQSNILQANIRMRLQIADDSNILRFREVTKSVYVFLSVILTTFFR